MNCTNCGAKLSCGCQKRTASDGKQVCSNCLAKYELTIKSSPKSSTSPTNVNVFYNAPKK